LNRHHLLELNSLDQDSRGHSFFMRMKASKWSGTYIVQTKVASELDDPSNFELLLRPHERIMQSCLGEKSFENRWLGDCKKDSPTRKNLSVKCKFRHHGWRKLLRNPITYDTDWMCMVWVFFSWILASPNWLKKLSLSLNQKKKQQTTGQSTARGSVSGTRSQSRKIVI
jgi:hypothetical protein